MITEQPSPGNENDVAGLRGVGCQRQGLARFFEPLPAVHTHTQTHIHNPGTTTNDTTINTQRTMRFLTRRRSS